MQGFRTAHWFCLRQYDELQFWVIYFKICWVHVKLLPAFSITVILVLRQKPALSKYSIFNLKLYEATNSWISFYYHGSPVLYKSCRWLKVTNIMIIIICLWLPNGSEGPCVHWEDCDVCLILAWRWQLLSQNTGVVTHSIQWPQTILI